MVVLSTMVILSYYHEHNCVLVPDCAWLIWLPAFEDWLLILHAAIDGGCRQSRKLSTTENLPWRRKHPLYCSHDLVSIQPQQPKYLTETFVFSPSPFGDNSFKYPNSLCNWESVSQEIVTRPVTEKIEQWIERITTSVLSYLGQGKMNSQLESRISQWGPNPWTENVLHGSLENAEWILDG